MAAVRGQVDAVLAAANQLLRHAEKPDARPYLLITLLLKTGIKKSECMAITLEHLAARYDEEIPTDGIAERPLVAERTTDPDERSGLERAERADDRGDGAVDQRVLQRRNVRGEKFKMLARQSPFHRKDVHNRADEQHTVDHQN